jgi:23S rRNA (adenine2503-C2)-methyltransferase
MLALSTLDDAGLAGLLDRLGAPAWRARQLRQATWRPDLAGFDEATELPRSLRESLPAELRFSTVEVAAASEADHGRTVKLLCRLGDRQTVETVAMESPASGAARRRATVCVSTQVGCAVGCPFCATGQMGLRRSCTAAEVVDQVRAAARELHTRGLGPVTHVVYMGMGEPLAAYDATVASIRVLTGGLGLSARRITVSTSGLVPQIERLAGEGAPVTLAVSLHAATDVLRDRLVPVNRAHPLESLLAAASAYAQRTGRRITLEWCLIGGVNDSVDQAAGLHAIARRLQAHVNVIPMNHVDGSPWGPPDPATARRFIERLRGVRTTVRDTRGGDADAACGQLRAHLERRRVLQPDGTLSPMRRVAAAAAR